MKLKSKPKKHKEKNTFKFVPFSERITQVDVHVSFKIPHKNEFDDAGDETFFYKTLCKWDVLNLSAAFEKVRNDLPNCQTLPLLINEKDRVLNVILNFLETPDPLALEAVLGLLTSMIMDLCEDIYLSFNRILKALTNLLNTKDGEVLEMVFTCLAYAFKSFWKYMVNDLKGVFESVLPLFSHSRPSYINNFAAESFAYVARKIKDKDKRYFLMLMLKTLKTELDCVEGCGRLIFEILRGVSGTFHRDASSFLSKLLDLLYNTSIDQILLYDLATHMISAMCRFINTEAFCQFWTVSFDVLYESLNLTDSCNDGRWLILKLLKQAVEYNDCMRLGDPGFALRITDLLGQLANEKREAMLLVEISAVILKSRHVSLSQEDASKIRMKILGIEAKDIVLHFIYKIIDDPCFDTYILPWVKRRMVSALQEADGSYWFDSSALQLLATLILKRMPPRVCSLELEHWKRYNLYLSEDLNMRRHKSHFVKVLELYCKKLVLDEFEDLLCILFITPHVDFYYGIHARTAYDELNDLVLRVLNEMCKFGKDVTEDAQLQKLLFVYGSALEAQIHVRGSRDIDAKLFSMTHVETILKYVEEPQYISALYTLDLYLTAFNLKDLEEGPDFLFDMLRPVLLGNLSSPFQKIRLITAHIFLLFESLLQPCEECYFALIVQAESIPVTIENYRDKLLLLNKLSNECVANCQIIFKEAVLFYLLGVFYVNFEPLWEPVTKLVASYARGLSQTSFWKIFLLHLQRADQHIENSPRLPTNNLFNCEFLNEFYENVHLLDDKPDFSNFRVLLWKTFATFPELCEMKSRDVSPLFLNFWEKFQKKTNSEQTFFCNIKKTEVYAETGDYDGPEDDNEEQSLKFQDVRTLLAYMGVFAKVRNPRAIYKEPELRSIYYNILAHRINTLQEAALSCIMTYKDKYLLPYREHVYGLLDDGKFQNEITVFNLDKDSLVVQDEHRADLMPVIMRILYGRMQTKTRRRTGGKNSAPSRRVLVLRFISGCKEEEVLIFLKIAFRLFESFLQEEPEEMVQNISESVDLSHVITTRKQRSFINLLQAVIKNLGSLMKNEVLLYILQVLLCIAAGITAVLSRTQDVHDGFVRGFKLLKNSCLEAATEFFDQFVNFPWRVQYVNATFEVFVWPTLEKLHYEGIHNPTVLLKLFLTWSREPKYFPFLIKHKKDHPEIYALPFIMKLLINVKSHPLVRNSIIDLVHSLLTTDEEHETNQELVTLNEGVQIAELNQDYIKRVSEKSLQNLNFGTMLLIPHVPEIIKHMKLKLQRKKSLHAKELLIMSRMCHLVSDPETSEALSRLLFPVLRKKNNASIETVVDMLTTLKNLLQNVPDPLKHLMSLAPLFGSLSGVGPRKLLCEILSNMVCSHSDPIMEKCVKAICDLNARDQKWIEQPDFEKRLKGFKCINDMIDTKSYMGDFGVIILYNCFHVLKLEKDMSLRDASSHCLHKLAPFLCMASNKESSFVTETILALISSGISDKARDIAQYESITLLGEMVRECSSAHPVLQDLIGLSKKDDPEVDFFNNLVHLQSYRKSKALTRFCEVAEKWEKRPNSRTLTQFILPIVSSFLCNERFSGKNSIVDGAIKSIGIICRLLPWNQYERILKLYLQKLRTTPEFQKQLVRIVVAVLNGFHFDVSSSSLGKENVSSNEVKVKTGNSSSLTTDVSMEGRPSAVETEGIKKGSVKRKVSEGVELADEELREITEDKVNVSDAGDENTDELEAIEKDESNGNVTGDEEEEEEGNGEGEEDEEEGKGEEGEEEEMEEESGTNLVNIEPAINHQIKLTQAAATRVVHTVLKVLLPQLHDTIGQYTHTEKVNKTNRKKYIMDHGEDDILRIPMALAVVKLLQCLPSCFLEDHLAGVFMKICTFLKSRLESVRRVARETLQNIMRYLGPSYLHVLFEEMQCLLTKGFQTHVLIFTVHSVLSHMESCLTRGDLDDCVHQLLTMFQVDIFGSVFEEKSIPQIVGKTPEARSNKSYNIMRIVAQYCTEACFLDMLIPLKKVMMSATSHKVLTRVAECLRNIVRGLSDNSFVTTEDLLKLAFGTASGTITMLDMENKESSDKGKNKQPTLKRPDTFLIPKAPRNRYGTYTTSICTSTSVNSYLFVEFGLQLTNTLFKRGKIIVDEHLHYVDPLVEVVRGNLAAKQVMVTVLSLRCLIYLIKVKPPSLRPVMNEITVHLFALLHKYATSGLPQGDHKNMVVAAFRAITTIIRDVKYQAIYTDQLKALLLYVEKDMHDHMGQATAFPLLRAILSRKLVAQEIDDVITRVAHLSVVSEHTHVRVQSREAVLEYIVNYPVRSKIIKFVDFYAGQLHYKVVLGRMSAIDMIHSMVLTFPHEILEKFYVAIYCALSIVLTNDNSSVCREKAASCIKKLILKSDRDYLFSVTLDFLNNHQAPVRGMGAQLCGLFVEIEKEDFEKRLGVMMPHLEREINCSKGSNMPGRFVKVPKEKKNENEIVKEEQEKIDDHCIYLVLELTKKICSFCPVFLRVKTWQPYIDNIGERAQYFLAHDHEWVRLQACVILGHIFSNANIELLAKTASGLCEPVEGSFLLQDSKTKLKSLVLDLCAQFIPNKVGGELIEQVTKNLAFLGRVALAMSEDEVTEQPSSEEKPVKISISWMIRQMRKIVYKEINDTPSLFVLRVAVFKWIGAMVHELPSDMLKLQISQLLAPLARELMNEEDSHPDVIHLAREIIKIVKKKVGLDAFSQAFSVLQQHLMARRAIRKKERAQLAVARPEIAAKRKIRLQQKKKVQKRRKLDALKGRIVPRKKMKSHDSGEQKSSKWKISPLNL